jgi:hypothetical protein
MGLDFPVLRVDKALRRRDTLEQRESCTEFLPHSKSQCEVKQVSPPRNRNVIPENLGTPAI